MIADDATDDSKNNSMYCDAPGVGLENNYPWLWSLMLDPRFTIKASSEQLGKSAAAPLKKS
jgi:hypothetical protein